jgi:hypothetical protein
LAKIYQGKHFVVQHLRASAHVRVIRSDAPFDSVSDATAGLDECSLALAKLEHKQYAILFDWRSAPLSTDPDLHKLLVERIDGLAARFRLGAFLVRAGVGTMQANRVGRVLSSGALPIFNDEAQAVEFLITQR